MYYIYRIINKLNGKTYIGQHRYKKLDDNYMGSGKILKAAKAKYGMENFEKEILVFNVSKREHADLLEKTFIAVEREKVGRENCYNITDGGNGGNLGGEVNKKISEARKGKPSHNKGKPMSEEQKKKISETLKGHPVSEEVRKKVSESNKRRLYSDETRRKMSEAKKGKPTWNKGKSSWNKGKHWKLVDGKQVYY